MKKTVILNPSDLIGQEIKDQLGLLGGHNGTVRLLTTDPEQVGTLTDIGGAAAMVQAYEADSFEGCEVAFFCGPFERCRDAMAHLPADATGVVLSPDAAADQVGPYGVGGISSVHHELVLSPDPAAVHIAQLLHAVGSLGVVRASATVVQPASHLGAAALDELMDQTRKVLAFQTPGGGDHFDRQIVFNLLPTEDAGRVEAQLAAILTGFEEMPRTVPVQMVQGGVFHGLSLSLYLELRDPADADAIADRFALKPHIQNVDELVPGPIDAAASDRILVAPARPVAGVPGAFWLWSVMDNLTRGAALNAIGLAGIEIPVAN